jgi:hypothetical protein
VVLVHIVRLFEGDRLSERELVCEGLIEFEFDCVNEVVTVLVADAELVIERENVLLDEYELVRQTVDVVLGEIVPVRVGETDVLTDNDGVDEAFVEADDETETVAELDCASADMCTMIANQATAQRASPAMLPEAA